MSEEIEYRKDACGQDVKVGDLVTYVAPYHHRLTEGYIVKFTTRGFSMSSEKGGDFVCNRIKQQVVKLPVELRLERLLA